METCLICGQAHGNAIRGGKVTLLRNCFKRARGWKTPDGTSPRRMVRESKERERMAVVNGLQGALDQWGVSGGTGFGELADVSAALQTGRVGRTNF